MKCEDKITHQLWTWCRINKIYERKEGIRYVQLYKIRRKWLFIMFVLQDYHDDDNNDNVLKVNITSPNHQWKKIYPTKQPVK